MKREDIEEYLTNFKLILDLSNNKKDINYDYVVEKANNNVTYIINEVSINDSNVDWLNRFTINIINNSFVILIDDTTKKDSSNIRVKIREIRSNYNRKISINTANLGYRYIVRIKVNDDKILKPLLDELTQSFIKDIDEERR